VTIDSDGRWSVATEASNSPVPDSEDDNEAKLKVVDLDDDDDDRPMMRSSPSSFMTSSAGRKADSVPRNNNGTNKRPASHVIDLTLSDDDEPPRPTKRNNTLPTPSSVGSGFSRLDSEVPNEYSPVGTPTYHYNQTWNNFPQVGMSSFDSNVFPIQ
jgi:E3 SUMO-protein ligase PIAS1